MRRVVVVGPAGSGKTTVAAALAERLALPHTELDALWWDAHWTEVGAEVFRARLRPVVAGDRWVVDGNFFTVGARDVAWPRADTIVFLDLPRWRTIGRVLRRSVRRSATRTELWAGNRERLRTLFGRDELLRFAWRAFPKYRRRYRALAGDPAGAHLTWIVLRTPREVRDWLASV